MAHDTESSCIFFKGPSTPQFQAVPEEGTLLAIWRGGEVGVFPWDSDFDLKLYTHLKAEDDPTHSVENFHEGLKLGFNRTWDPDPGERKTQAWNFHGCGDDEYFLVRIPNITHHIGDVYYRSGVPKSANPWRVELFTSGRGRSGRGRSSRLRRRGEYKQARRPSPGSSCVGMKVEFLEDDRVFVELELCLGWSWERGGTVIRQLSLSYSRFVNELCSW